MSRKRISLDGTWEFYPDPKQQLTHQSLRQEDARGIRVPGPWQAQFDDLRDYSGVASSSVVPQPNKDYPSARPPVAGFPPDFAFAEIHFALRGRADRASARTV